MNPQEEEAALPNFALNQGLVCLCLLVFSLSHTYTHTHCSGKAGNAQRLELNVNDRASVSLFVLSTFIVSPCAKPPEELQERAAPFRFQRGGVSQRRL